MDVVVTRDVVVRGPEVTERTMAVAAMFGLGLAAEQRLTILKDVRVPVEKGTIVLLTGASGAGKSTLLRAVAEELERRGVGVWRLGLPPPNPAGHPAPPETPALVDGLGDRPLPEVLACLAQAGLGEAFVMLRRPHELSDGQRFRYELARWYASDVPVLAADEFCATLDRLTAKVVAFNLRRFVTESGRTAVVATTHEDLLEDLRPEVWVRKALGPGAEVRLSDAVRDDRSRGAAAFSSHGRKPMDR